MTLFRKLLLTTIVQTPSLGQLQITHDQLIAVDIEGHVVEIASKDSDGARSIIQKASTQSPPVVVTKLPPGSFLLPTFVDLHLHAPQFLYLGTGLHLPLMQWLNEYAYKAEERLDADAELANRVYARLAERLLEAGTGAVLAFGTIKSETNRSDANERNELLLGLGKLVEAEGVHVQSHLAEARDQVDWVRSTRNAEDIDVFDKVG
ncbi:hypothetical protein FRC00_005124 [Tulasnella sp. 408]|nr:hypothetical protein FRC00_005124 [Tulasnella sp. 408]